MELVSSAPRTVNARAHRGVSSTNTVKRPLDKAKQRKPEALPPAFAWEAARAACPAPSSSAEEGWAAGARARPLRWPKPPPPLLEGKRPALAAEVGIAAPAASASPTGLRCTASASGARPGMAAAKTHRRQPPRAHWLAAAPRAYPLPSPAALTASAPAPLGLASIRAPTEGILAEYGVHAGRPCGGG